MSLRNTDDFLFEIGCEELPSRYIGQLLDQLATNMCKLLDNFRIVHGEVHTFATARRLAVVVDCVAHLQQDTTQQKLGPWHDQAYDVAGKPTPALLGFARSCGVLPDALQHITVRGKQRISAHIQISGDHTLTIFPSLLAQLMTMWHLPHAMAWGDGAYSFVRPVRWLCALFGEHCVPFSAYGIESSTYTYGKRFMYDVPIRIAKPSDYEMVLKKALVIASVVQRKQRILDQIDTLIAGTSLRAMAKPSLIEELVGLVEYPMAMLGNFHADFLTLPREILITTLEKHQRYICLEDSNGKLSHNFIVITNAPQGNQQEILHGNSQVLRPRLEDAAFFWRRDCETGLSGMHNRLSEIVFETKLGSMAEKEKRLIHLCSYFAKLFDCQQQQLIQAASVAKADLLSHTVGEFPELQGIVGGYLATVEGYSQEVAQIIGQHYLPVFDGDTLPNTLAAKILSLADKIDHLCGLFICNKQGNATSDPFGTRRASLGIVQLLLAIGDRKTSLTQIIQIGFASFEDNNLHDSVEAMHRFIIDRATHWFVKSGIPLKILQSVLLTNIDNIVDIQLRADFLSQNKHNTTFQNLGQFVKRIRNICKGFQPTYSVDESLWQTMHEKTLWRSYQHICHTTDLALQNANFMQYMQLCTQLQTPLSNFFDNVMVTGGSKQEVTNKMNMLCAIERTCCTLADFTHID